MTSVLFDTNILIDALKGYREALSELAWDLPAMSVITWIEAYAGASADEAPKFDNFLGRFGFEVIPIDEDVMKAAAELMASRLRRGRKIALADAVLLLPPNSGTSPLLRGTQKTSRAATSAFHTNYKPHAL